MGTIRVSHNKNYTCIHNQSIRDTELSFKARGIHHLLLSFPDDWIVNISHLIGQSKHDGRDAIRSGLAELERQGYLVRNQSRNHKGQFSKADYTIFEFPIEDLPDRENPATVSRRRETVAGKSNHIINNDLRSNDFNEVLRDEVSILSKESEEKAPEVCVEKIDPRPTSNVFEVRKAPPAGTRTSSGERAVACGASPDRADGKEKLESVYPTEQQRDSVSCQKAEVFEKEKVPLACNTTVRKSLTGKPSTLELQKQKAAQSAIAGGCFESPEQEDDFFAQVQVFLKAVNPGWEPTKVIGTAVNQTRRLKSGETDAEDRQNFRLFLSGEMAKYSGLSYDHKMTQLDEADKKRQEKEAFYAQFQNPNAPVRSKLLR